jgi:hypothetical protein
MKFLNIVFILLVSVSFVSAQNYNIFETGEATPKKKKVLHLKEPTGKNDIILFQTNLHINTDGSPLSYHPQDINGKKGLALNTICNAIAVYPAGAEHIKANNLCLKKDKSAEAYNVIKSWIDSNYKTIANGYELSWQSVLAAKKSGDLDIPCIFKTGLYKGYFGSQTALQNGLTSNLGECEINNQVNPMTVPALVLLGGKNIVTDFGAKVGDLLVAYNPKTKITVSAIIGDSGPDDNLGEGSVYLNMKLTGATKTPTTKAEIYKLSIEDKILVAIIPGSKLFEINGNKPYTAENINRRVKNWQKNAGFSTPDKFIQKMKEFQAQL